MPFYSDLKAQKAAIFFNTIDLTTNMHIAD